MLLYVCSIEWALSIVWACNENTYYVFIRPIDLTSDWYRLYMPILCSQRILYLVLCMYTQTYTYFSLYMFSYNIMLIALYIQIINHADLGLYLS